MTSERIEARLDAVAGMLAQNQRLLDLIAKKAGVTPDDYRELLPQLHWAPYREFGPPDQSAETTEPPGCPVAVRATGYRGNCVIVYWSAA